MLMLFFGRYRIVTASSPRMTARNSLCTEINSFKKSDEAIIGYMNIKRKKGKILIVNIPIGDYIYTFKWDVNRKK
jgi:hypothetical protein